MYAESGLMFPYFQTFSPDTQQFDDLCYSHNSNASLGSVVQSSNISDYDIVDEGELFKAPKLLLDQPLTTFDSMNAAVAMTSCGEEDINSQELSVTDIESLQNADFLNDVFHEYKDIIEKGETETSPLSEVLNYKFAVKVDESLTVKENVHPPGPIPKSTSSDCLSSTEWVNGPRTKLGFLNITEVNFGNFSGMRRAFSEGDIKALGQGNVSHRNSSVGPPQVLSEDTIEDRWLKLSRYRNKKTKRNFGRKIKYACRKTLADSQPRIRGRFAKTE